MCYGGIKIPWTGVKVSSTPLAVVCVSMTHTAHQLSYGIHSFNGPQVRICCSQGVLRVLV
jgi:hypothetical protein